MKLILLINILKVSDILQNSEPHDIRHDTKITLMCDHSNTDVCSRIRNELEKHNSNVVMDTYDEGKFELSELTELMKKTSILVACLSQSYKKSAYFLMQYKYVLLTRKKMIPVLMDDNYEFTEFLNFNNNNSADNKLTVIDFASYTDNFQDFVQRLLEEIYVYSIKFQTQTKRVPSAFLTDCNENDKDLAKMSLLGNKTSDTDETSNYENDDSLNSSSRGGDLNLSYSIHEGGSKLGDPEIPTADTDELLDELNNDPTQAPNESTSKSAKSSKRSSAKSFKLNSALRSALPSKWSRKQVKMWFELNNISLTIFKCLGSCDGELLFTYHQILSVEPKFFFEEILKKRNTVLNETFDADDITTFRLKLKSLFS